jgi:hypothetical protein
VRYAGFAEKQYVRRKDWASAIIEVKFKINDPVTRYMIFGGAIIKKV